MDDYVALAGGAVTLLRDAVEVAYPGAEALVAGKLRDPRLKPWST